LDFLPGKSTARQARQVEPVFELMFAEKVGEKSTLKSIWIQRGIDWLKMRPSHFVVD